MMRFFVTLLLAITFSAGWSQDHFQVSEIDSSQKTVQAYLKQLPKVPNRILPIESYFRDKMLTSLYFCPTAFPVENSEANYLEQNHDTKKRYSDFGYYLHGRELIELKDKNNYLWITPLLDISLGRDLVADSLKKISQNTRGVRMEGNFNDRVLFTTSFYENQAILPDYAAQYALSKGEFYPNQSNGTYSQVNAVVSGAARTKPFDANGFDYAYAVGSVMLRINRNMKVSWGNNSLFVGSGYRSMLWSDHSLGAMNLRFQWKINNHIYYQFVRMRGINMLRRIGGVNGEAFYEPTSLSMSTIYFRLNQVFQIGIFEGGVWDRGDSITKKPVDAAYFIPLPGASALTEAVSGRSNTVLGLDASAHLRFAHVYGQFAMNPFVANSSVMQFGVRLYRYEGSVTGGWLQFEYNQANRNGYMSTNPRMNYASYNLPLAHPAGTNFQEFLVRAHYEDRGFYGAASFHYYPKQLEQSSLLPIYTTVDQTFKKVALFVLESGYKFNRSYGLECFAQFRYRKSEGTNVMESSWLSAGIRTAIRNHYYDY